MRRQSFLAVSSLTLVAVAGTAIASAALAQTTDAATARTVPGDVPVTFGTDPGEAHPRYAQATTYVDRANAGPASLQFAAAEAPEREAAPAPQLQQASFKPVQEAPAPIADIRTGTLDTVTVQAGDTVYGLARRYGLSPAAIIRQNDLRAPYTLGLGQTLTLPKPSVDEAPVMAAAPAQAPTPAPVIEARPAPVEAPIITAAPAPITVAASDLTGRIERVEERDRLDALYAVRAGDTLYGLSRKFDVPVAEIARVNGLAAPYGLSLGQKLVIPSVVPATPQEAVAALPNAGLPLEAAPMIDAMPSPRDTNAILVDRAPTSAFAWPLKGAIVSGYGTSLNGVRNDGINIAAPEGAPVRAAADGDVVYKGDELSGYGNLLLIKHEDGWVSAYAHTGDILVRKGDRVRQGQVVAKVGKSGSVDAPQLHFELRHDLKPQDPVAALNGSLETASYRSR